MPFKKVAIEAVEPVGPNDEQIPPGAEADSVGAIRVLTGALDTDGVSINHYEFAPGESFTVSIHGHGVRSR